MLLALCLTTVSCEDTDALKSDINSLNDRVTALESKVKMLNDNIASLHVLLQNGIIITTVENADGVYTLTLSDGTVLKLAEKTAGFGNTPLVSIDAEGNWQVSYDNGQTFQPMMQGDNKVPAIVDDGVTPKFRVSTDGFWEISYDGGTTYERVKDEAGNDVKAVYDAGTSDSQAFVGAAVSADGNSLELTLADGTTKVSVPIVPDFFCYFDETITGEQKINKGETKTFNLHIKGADQTIVTAPTGWKAVLGDADASTNIAVLTVTAPGAAASAASTKATADNTRDISVLAMKGGFATIAKLQVNPIDVTIGGGDEGGDEGGGTDEPAGTNMIKVPFADASIVMIYNKDPQTVTDQTGDFWFYRSNTKDLASAEAQGTVKIVDETLNGTAIKAVEIDCKIANSFYKVDLGYYMRNSGCTPDKKYKLSFMVKGVNGTKLLSTIRVAGSKASVGVYNKDGDPTTTISTTALKSDSWESASMVFDFSKKAQNVGGVTTDNPLSATTVDDLTNLDIRIYPQAANTKFYIADVKFEEYTE